MWKQWDHDYTCHNIMSSLQLPQHDPFDIFDSSVDFSMKGYYIYHEHNIIRAICFTLLPKVIFARTSRASRVGSLLMWKIWGTSCTVQIKKKQQKNVANFEVMESYKTTVELQMKWKN